MATKTCTRPNCGIIYSIRNDGDHFVDVATAAGVATPHWSTGAAWADYDLDGDLDLYVASYAVFDSTKVERLGAQWKGVEVFVGPRGLMGAADVFYRNDGDEFADITAWARLNHPFPRLRLGASCSRTRMTTGGPTYSWPTTLALTFFIAIAAMAALATALSRPA